MAIPKGTEIPKSPSAFAKLEDGKNKFRVLSDVVIGWEGWKDKKPFRHKGAVCKIKPEQVDVNPNNQKPNINYFWAMLVWNYKDESVQILEITQKTVMTPLSNLEDNPDWGDLKNYDIEIKKEKVGDKTTYTVLGIPPKPLDPKIKKALEESDVSLDKLFEEETVQDPAFGDIPA